MALHHTKCPNVLLSCLQVDVRIIEPQGIRYVHVPNSLGDHFNGITTISKGEKKVTVTEWKQHETSVFIFIPTQLWNFLVLPKSILKI